MADTSPKDSPFHRPAEPEGDAWTVWRQDDNGNHFVVREGLTHEEAKRTAAELEARGHKQRYWIERRR